MFNRDGFNELPFNRTADIAVYGSFEIDLECNVEMIGNMEMHGAFEMDLSTELDFSAVRERFGAFVIDATAEMDFSAVRERTGRFEINAELDIVFAAGRYHVDVIVFTGEFKPGDKIEIDSDQLKMLMNSTNALHLMQGDFFDLNTGENELTYTDDQSGRTVRIRVTHKDKFV